MTSVAATTEIYTLQVLEEAPGICVTQKIGVGIDI